jgi:hypothetical protein
MSWTAAISPFLMRKRVQYDVQLEAHMRCSKWNYSGRARSVSNAALVAHCQANHTTAQFTMHNLIQFTVVRPQQAFLCTRLRVSSPCHLFRMPRVTWTFAIASWASQRCGSELLLS